ncbi:MAG TPA: hypothetical protein VGF23_20410 [Gaiellaceae bacterium]
MINVLPEEAQARPCGCTLGFSSCGGSCDLFTICIFSGCRECSGQFTCIGATQCGGCTLNVTCPGSVVFEQGAVDPQALATLKSQLREALRAVETAEQVMAERMSPQSVEEVEALEEKLQGALDELKARKKQLREREAGSES